MKPGIDPITEARGSVTGLPSGPVTPVNRATRSSAVRELGGSGAIVGGLFVAWSMSSLARPAMESKAGLASASESRTATARLSVMDSVPASTLGPAEP
ncbi:hypothetical protein [Arthrobacter sp. 754]|uniref:hypothetical protein n=1 Tax=Arthrobacter sp. 754 TaxID=3156315 RepID=UPI00339460AF